MTKLDGRTPGPREAAWTHGCLVGHRLADEIGDPEDFKAMYLEAHTQVSWGQKSAARADWFAHVPDDIVESVEYWWNDGFDEGLLSTLSRRIREVSEEVTTPST